MKKSLFCVLFFAFLSTCIQATKRKNDSEDESINNITPENTQPRKKIPIIPSEFVRFVKHKISMYGVHYLYSKGKINAADGFVYLYENTPDADAKFELAKSLVKNKYPIETYHELKEFDIDCWAHLLAASVVLEDIEVFKFCIPLVNSDSQRKEDAFHKIVDPAIFRNTLQNISFWASKIYGQPEESTVFDTVIPDSSVRAVSALFSNLREQEIDFLLPMFKRMKLYEILKSSISMAVERYSPEDEYSILAKLALIEISNSLRYAKNITLMKLTEDEINDLSFIVRNYKTSLTANYEVGQRVMKIVITNSKNETTFPTIVSALIKKFPELMNLGALYFFKNYVGTSDFFAFPYVEFSNFDPSYKNYQVFEFLLCKSTWSLFENIPSGGKWNSIDCVKNIYRILKEIIPKFPAKFGENKDRLPIGTFMENENEFVIDPTYDTSVDDYEDSITTIYHAVIFVFDNEILPYVYFKDLLVDLSFHIPYLIPYLHGRINLSHNYDSSKIRYYINSFMNEHGEEFIERVMEKGLLDAAIYAAYVSKLPVAIALLKIYDEIPNRECDVTMFTDVNKGPIKFFRSILSHLYKNTEYAGRDLHDKEKWGIEDKIILYSFACSLVAKNHSKAMLN